MKKVLSIIMCLVMVLGVFAALPFTMSAKEIDLSDVGAAYDMSYWQGWSQGASDYSIMRQYGCWVVAMSKMFMETGIAQSGLNPDVLYWWERNNGWLPNNDYNLNQVDGYNAAVAYANSQGKTLEPIAQNWSVNDSVLWSYINNGYYTIIQVSNFEHYVYIDNYRSKLTGEIYIMESFTDSTYAGSYSLHSRYSGVARAMTYRYAPVPEYQASIPRGQDSTYMTDEDVTMSVNAESGDSCWIQIWYTPVGGSPYAFWEGNIPSNSYTRKFEKEGYYSCWFHVTHGGTTYNSKWVGWYVVPPFHATTDKGEEAQYGYDEDVIISIDNLDFDSVSLHMYYTPKGGTTSKYLDCEASKEPLTFQFDKEGHYSCHYTVTRNGNTFSSKWVGWDVIAPVYRAITDKGEEAQYGYGEDVIISIDNLDFDTASLHMVYTPIGGSTSSYLDCDATKEPLTFQFDKEGHYSCYYSVIRNGKRFDSKWVGWDIVPAYHAIANKGIEALYDFGEDVIISIDYHDYDSASLHIYYTPTGGTTINYLNCDVSKEPVVFQFDKEGHYSCYYSVIRNGKTYNSKWVGWDVGVQSSVTILGDVDGDEEVGVLDATYIQRYNAGFDIPISEEVILSCGDIDGDEEVTIIDATYIQRYDAGFNTPYPIGETIA